MSEADYEWIPVDVDRHNQGSGGGIYAMKLMQLHESGYVAIGRFGFNVAQEVDPADLQRFDMQKRKAGAGYELTIHVDDSLPPPLREETYKYDNGQWYFKKPRRYEDLVRQLYPAEVHDRRRTGCGTNLFIRCSDE